MAMTRDEALAFVAARAGELKLLGPDGRPTADMRMFDVEAMQWEVLVNLEGRGVIVRQKGDAAGAQKFSWREVTAAADRIRHKAYAKRAYAQFAGGDAA